jgi:glycosyltransferase involved in cell wall biosynthesis
MKRVFLLHEGLIQHYRIPVYSYLSDYLKNHGISLVVIAEGRQPGDRQDVSFQYYETKHRLWALNGLLEALKPEAVILWAKPHLYTYPFFLKLKRRNIKIIHWGHRRAMPPFARSKKLIANFEHWLDDAIILYSEAFRAHVFKRFQNKTFVANNTLNLTAYQVTSEPREDIKRRLGITTTKNIIYLGRIQRRRRLDHLFQVLDLLGLDDVGLILAGPDDEGILGDECGKNIFKLGPLYGQAALDALSASDVYCQPNAIGLSIVDALFCGLPVVTENGLHGPEIMYLKEGINGFMVPEGAIEELTARLRLLLSDEPLRRRFSQAAREEIMTHGHIDRMCEGFWAALDHAFNAGSARTDRP